MAVPDVLQFHYFIDNEIARNATKDFAGMLGKAFVQYKQLWNEYLTLRKHCEDAAFDIPFQLLQSDKCNQDNVKLGEGQIPPDKTKKSTFTCESAYGTCRGPILSEFDDTPMDGKERIQRQAEEELLKSPILIKERSRAKRASTTNDDITLEKFEENAMYPCVRVKENISILIDTSKENVVPVEPKEDEMENNEIESTPVAKTPRKWGISKLYNVDTTVLPDGKKLRQSKIVLFPHGNTATNTGCHKLSPLKSYVSPIPEKCVKETTKRDKRSIDEDIIGDSPNKRKKSSLRVKSLKLKKKSPLGHAEKNNRNQKYMPDTSSDKSSSTSLTMKETNQSSLSQFLLPVHTSTQKEQPFLIRKSKTSGSFDESIDCDILSSSFSPAIVDIRDSCFDDTGNLNDNGTVKAKENINEAEGNKDLQIDSQILYDNSYMCHDETFCSLVENRKQRSTSWTNETKSIKENTCKSYILPEYQSVKKSLMNSFDILPEKTETNGKLSKKQSERAKMSGISCWECKKYYADLKLSEEEVKARQNQCSRHRTNYSEREGTPEGFWDPVFPDTYSSTFQDN